MNVRRRPSVRSVAGTVAVAPIGCPRRAIHAFRAAPPPRPRDVVTVQEPRPQAVPVLVTDAAIAGGALVAVAVRAFHGGGDAAAENDGRDQQTRERQRIAAAHRGDQCCARIT